MFALDVPRLMVDFHSTNVELASFVVSIYTLGFDFGPLYVAHPQRHLFLTNLTYIDSSHPCANCTNAGYYIKAAICFSSSSTPFTESPRTLDAFLLSAFWRDVLMSHLWLLVLGLIADLMAPEKRGSAMALFSFGPLLSPIIFKFLQNSCGPRNAALRLY